MKDETGCQWRMIVLFVFVPVAISFATTVTQIQLDLEPVQWYFGDGDYFQVIDKYTQADALVGLSVVTAEGGMPYFLTGTLRVDPVSNLLDDQTAENGGWAKGLFSAGARLTVAGMLYDINFAVVASGDLIIADIVNNWILKELESPPAAENTVKGKAFYDMIGGALFDGDNRDGLILYDFWGDFTFRECATEITDFESMTGVYECDDAILQIDIPEPCTLLFLSTGALLLIRRKKG